MLQFVIKYYGTAELLLIKSASVSLSRVKFIRHYADMAELADAYGSGPYVRKDMQVQVLLSAPKAKSALAKIMRKHQKAHKVCWALFVIVSHNLSNVNPDLGQTSSCITVCQL